MTLDGNHTQFQGSQLNAARKRRKIYRVCATERSAPRSSHPQSTWCMVPTHTRCDRVHAALLESRIGGRRRRVVNVKDALDALFFLGRIRRGAGRGQSRGSSRGSRGRGTKLFGRRGQLVLPHVHDLRRGDDDKLRAVANRPEGLHTTMIGRGGNGWLRRWIS
jgi:hypothetical protein